MLGVRIILWMGLTAPAVIVAAAPERPRQQQRCSTKKCIFGVASVSAAALFLLYLLRNKPPVVAKLGHIPPPINLVSNYRPDQPTSMSVAKKCLLCVGAGVVIASVFEWLFRDRGHHGPARPTGEDAVSQTDDGTIFVRQESEELLSVAPVRVESPAPVEYCDVAIGTDLPQYTDAQVQADDGEIIALRERTVRLLAKFRELSSVVMDVDTGQDTLDPEDSDQAEQKMDKTTATVSEAQLLNKIKLVGTRVFCTYTSMAVYQKPSTRLVKDQGMLLPAFKSLIACLPREIVVIRSLRDRLNAKGNHQLDELVDGVVDALGRFHEDLSPRDAAISYQLWNKLKSASDGLLTVLEQRLPPETLEEIERVRDSNPANCRPWVRLES